MNLISAVVICAIVSSASSSWMKDLKDLTEQKGFNFGSGFQLYLDTNDNKNSSLLEKHALRLDYAGYGVSIGKRKGKEAIEVGFYTNENGEGRGKKTGEMILPALIGFKLSSVLALKFATVGAIVLKALGIAKVAFVVASILIIHKLFSHGHHQSQKPYFEVDHLPSEVHPSYLEYPEELGYSPSGSANYITAYNNFIPSAAAESAMNYNTVESPGGVVNSSAAQVNPAQQAAAAAVVARRRDHVRKKPPVPVVTVHRYSIET